MARLGNNKSTAPKPKPSTVVLPYTTGQYFHPAPNGTHNPNIDSEVWVHGAELNDFLEHLEHQEDVKTRNTRQANKFSRQEQGRAIADRNRALGYKQTDLGYQLGQLGINFTRDIEDLSTAKIRGQQDYTRTLTNLQHEYGSKAEQQSQNAIQQGTDEAGTNTASAAVRGANQAFDKGNVDLSHQRAEDDLGTRQRRDEENYGTQKAHLEEGFGRDVTETGIANQRTQVQGRRQRHEASRALGEFLHEGHTEKQINERKQAEYETNAGRSSYYEANQLHPNLKFPGGQPPGGPHAGPHLYGKAAGPGLYGAVAAPAPPKGTNVNGARRLTPPRY